MIFKNYYDLDFFNSNKKHEYNNYKIFLIDGYIQSVGEIHHILQKSNEENIPFVIFCYGMNSDVKNTIIVNNKNKKTQVYPLSFEYNEDNLNIFNDIALIHGSDVISANNGQTISSAARKEFKTGKRIVIIPNSNCFIIEPVVDFKNIKQHINMLRSKINNKKLSETSKKNTIRRFKSLNSKNFKIFLPEKLINDYNFISRIHFYFSFLSKLNLEQKKVKFKNEIYFFPLIYLEYAKEKSKSLLDIFKNIEYGIEEI